MASSRTSRKPGPGGGRPTAGSRRVTPKGGKPPSTASRAHGAHADEANSRYTPPTPANVKHSGKWVPVTMFGLLGLGVLAIVLNLAHVAPGAPSGWYIVVGIAAITGGILAGTQYH